MESSDSEIERENLIMDGPSPERNSTYLIYKRRWYILSIFSILSFLQFMIWNAFGPIFTPVQHAYKWNLGTFSMMTNWGTITFVLFVFPFCKLQELRGLRFVVVIMAALIFLGAGFRALSINESLFTSLAHLGSILNGIAGALVMSAPSALSATWFPPSERMLATCISQSAAFLGSGFSFVIGPALVRNTTEEIVESLANNETVLVEEIKQEIREYMLMDVFLAFIFLLMALIYFPEEPPTPPSASASVERTKVMQGLKELVKNKDFVLCAFAYGLSGGTLLAWQGIITKNFEDIGIDDKTTGYIGLAMAISCSITATVLSFGIPKILKRHLKYTILVLLVLGVFFYGWLALLCNNIIPFSFPQVCISSVLGSSFVFSLTPVMFEYSAELTYPIPECLTGGSLTFMYNFCGAIILSLCYVPHIGEMWVDWALCITCLVGFPLVWLTKETYRRLEVDSPNPVSILLENPSAQSYQTLT